MIKKRKNTQTQNNGMKPSYERQIEIFNRLPLNDDEKKEIIEEEWKIAKKRQKKLDDEYEKMFQVV